MKRIIIGTLVAISASSASAAGDGVYRYICKPHSLVVVDENAKTLTWTGGPGGTATYTNLVDAMKDYSDKQSDGQDFPCARYGFIASKAGVTVKLCGATQGYASIAFGGKDHECNLKR
jgi:hypothetical protein